MKKIMIAAILGISVFAAHAQEVSRQQLPQPVLNAFTSLYPDAGRAEWKLENGKYETEFYHKGAKTEVVFDGSGNLQEIRSRIDRVSFPQSAIDYLDKNTAGSSSAELYSISDKSGITGYTAEVHHTYYLFDTNGNFNGMNGKSHKHHDDDEDDD